MLSTHENCDSVLLWGRSQTGVISFKCHAVCQLFRGKHSWTTCRTRRWFQRHAHQIFLFNHHTYSLAQCGPVAMVTLSLLTWLSSKLIVGTRAHHTHCNTHAAFCRHVGKVASASSSRHALSVMHARTHTHAHLWTNINRWWVPHTALQHVCVRISFSFLWGDFVQFWWKSILYGQFHFPQSKWG